MNYHRPPIFMFRHFLYRAEQSPGYQVFKDEFENIRLVNTLFDIFPYSFEIRNNRLSCFMIFSE